MSVSVPKRKLVAEDSTKTGLKISSKAYERISHIHKKKLRGFSPQANYTDRTIAAGQRS
jgi:hypothetical protein